MPDATNAATTALRYWRDVAADTIAEGDIGPADHRAVEFALQAYAHFDAMNRGISETATASMADRPKADVKREILAAMSHRDAGLAAFTAAHLLFDGDHGRLSTILDAAEHDGTQAAQEWLWYLLDEFAGLDVSLPPLSDGLALEPIAVEVPA